MANRDPESTRAALKAAARSLFARQGYEGTTIREIGKRSGMNMAMINYHFGGKQGLFSTIMAEELAALQASLSGSIRPGASPTERLRDFIISFAALGEDHAEFALILVREQMNGGLHLERHVRDRFFGFFLRSREIIDEGIRAGEFRPVDPHATHLSLVGSLIYYLLTMPARETYVRQGGLPTGIPTPAEYVQHVVELFLRGLRSDASVGEAPIHL